MHHLRSLLFSIFCLFLVIGLVGCGDFFGEAEEPIDLGNSDQPPEDEEELCELACERVYANLSDGGCQQNFSHDDGTSMNEDSCVESCVDDDLFHGGEWCVATELECKSHPNDMINECLSSNSENAGGPECEDLDTWDADAVQMEQEVLDLVNEERAAGADCGTEGEFGATHALEMNDTLRCAARLHSKDMFDRGYFDHNNPDGETPHDRIENAGYTGMTTGENIAAGQPDAQTVVAGWMDSDGHCANIMHTAFDEIGVGMYQDHWTQKFGG